MILITVFDLMTGLAALATLRWLSALGAPTILVMYGDVILSLRKAPFNLTVLIVVNHF